MKIKIPKGYTDAIYIEKYATAKYKYQKEVLLKRVCTFKVIDAKIENGKFYLELEVQKSETS